jgi:hypothetical protein
MLQHVISVSLLSAMAATAPVVSQGISPRASISGVARDAGPPATKVLVATPFPSSPADSTVAVIIGTALRQKLIDKIEGSEWSVITRRDMNTSFQTWGYNPDQLFPPDLARQVASSMSARMFVMTTLTKTSGLFTASIRVTGIADDAGQVVKVVQLAGQTPQDFGGKIAEQATIIFKAYPDARSCVDNVAANKPKAVSAATNAIKVVPNYGLAEYCLGNIEQAKDSIGPETLRHFTNAVIGDPFSLFALNQIRIIHEKKKDSTAVVADYQTMIRIAPTNQKLADEAVKKFKQYGRPDAADEVVDQQIKLDPTNADWQDLKGNSCMVQAATESDPAKAKPKFVCAYNAFVQELTLDPMRADTNFFPKIVFVAGNHADSMQWAKKWAEKYASIEDPYTLELQLYMDAGETDSALAVVKMLNAINPANPKPALAVDYALLKAKRYDDVIKLGAYFQKNGDDNSKNTYAGLLVTYADSETRATPRDDSLLVRIGKALVAFNAPNKQFVEYGYYFNASGLQPGFIALSKAARDDKSCDTVKQYEALMAIIDPLFTTLNASSVAGLAAYGKQMSDIATTEKAFFPTLEKAFCKPATKP